MEQVIFSPEGKRAALAAVKQGLPPLAFIDSLLKEALGSDYGKHNEDTAQAGYLVTNLMRQMGYKPVGSAPLPPGCIAKTGRLFTHDKNDQADAVSCRDPYPATLLISC
ncbi:hypothetical protein DC522_04875 [Microvirga sp. KLBC 81]|nr:hypothetical protein DC522_04875 [Microvirga sp. KLBC 81]